MDINGLLQNPEYTVGSAPIPESYLPAAQRSAATETETTASAAAGPSSAPAREAAVASSSSAAAAEAGDESRHQDMANLLFKWADQHLPIPEEEEASLTDILTPDTVGRLVQDNPALASALAHHMPKELGEVDTPAALLRVVGTSQFRDAVGSLEMALRTGTLPESTMPWIHLPKDQTWNLRNFLTALHDANADEEPKADEKMDTDE